MPFEGFSANETFSPLPDTFFRRLLAEIDDLDELKVTLYALWRLTAARGTARFLREEDFVGCGAREVASGLQRAVGRGTLLQVEHESGRFYFLNSPYGRLAAEALRSGRWHPRLFHLAAPSTDQSLSTVRGQYRAAYAHPGRCDSRC